MANRSPSPELLCQFGDMLLKSNKHPEVIKLMEAVALHEATPTPQTFALIAVIAGDIVYGSIFLLPSCLVWGSNTRKYMFFCVRFKEAVGASSFPRVGDTWRPPGNRTNRGFPSQGPFCCLQWGSWQDGRKPGTAPSPGHWAAPGGWAEARLGCVLAGMDQK